MAAECGINWGMFQHILNKSNNKKILAITARKLERWLDRHDEYMPDEWKRCTKCGKVKPLADFYRDSSRSSGRRPACAECTKLIANKNKEKKENMSNNNTETAITEEIVKKVKAEDKSDVPSSMLAPYFGITQKQLESIRNGDWDNLLYKKEEPKPATSAKEAVEALRMEIADMHTALNRMLMEMGCIGGTK